MAENALTSGAALDRFRTMIEMQGGDPNVIEDYGIFPQAKRQTEIFAAKDGYITGISCEETGLVSLKLGAGRAEKNSEIDPTAGIVFDKTVGDKVSKGERLAVMYTSTDCDMNGIGEQLAGVFSYGDLQECPEEKNIIKIVKGY